MKAFTVRIRVLAAFATVFAVAVAVCRALAIWLHYDPITTYIEKQTFLPIFYIIAIPLFTAILIAFSLFYTIRKSDNNLAPIFPLPPAMAVVTGISMISVISIFARYFVMLISQVDANEAGNSIFLLVSFLSVIAFALNLFVKNQDHSDARAVLGIAPALMSVVIIFTMYLDRSTMLNDENKIVATVGFVFAALFYLTECKFSFGEKPLNLWFPAASACAFICISAFTPNFILLFTTGLSLSVNEFQAFFGLATGIYALTRLLTVREDADVIRHADAKPVYRVNTPSEYVNFDI
jgi:hypothetical protein